MGIIRLLLAASVFIAHSALPLFGTKLIGGAPAVQCFFIVSGFYMALILNRGYPRLGDFYFNRLLRLYPLYWCAVFVATVCSLTVSSPTIFEKLNNSPEIGNDALVLMYFANFAIFGSNAMMFLVPSLDGLDLTLNFAQQDPKLYTFHAIPQAWSLPLELWFYLLAPFVVRSWPRIVILIGVSAALRVVVFVLIGRHDPWSYRFFPTELVFFGVGALAYFWYDRVRLNAAASGIGFISLILIVAGMFFYSLLPDPKFPIFLCSFVLLMPFIFHATKNSKLDKWIGELSYPFYLLHLIVIDHVDSAMAGFFITLAAAALVNEILQNPIERSIKRHGGAARVVG